MLARRLLRHRTLSQLRSCFPPKVSSSFSPSSSSSSSSNSDNPNPSSGVPTSLFSHFSPGPSPPRLPLAEQAEWERLQKLSMGAFSQPKPNLAVEETSTPEPPVIGAGAGEEEEMLHPNIRRGAPPEFEGEKNPRTGEIGGPKVEPLRWGGEGDWSYNGRVTDF